MPLTIIHSLSWMMLAFADWSSTGTHYQVCYFSDVALPELHSNSVTDISFTTYYGMPFGSLRVKKYTVALSKQYKKSLQTSKPQTRMMRLQYPVGNKASFVRLQLMGLLALAWYLASTITTSLKTMTSRNCSHFQYSCETL